MFYMVKGKKKISRRRPGQTTSKVYFTLDTQDAIVLYQGEKDINVKNKLYEEKIYPAFSSLVENLINVFGFHVMYESKSDLKNECLEYMHNIINKYDVTKGSKAFSYFNVCAKHWLTIQSKNNTKKIQTYVSLSDRDSLSKHDFSIIENFDVIPSAEDVITGINASQSLRKIIEELKKHARTDNENLCVEAISEIADKIEDIDLLSKRAVMCYIRDITGLTSKQLSIVLSSLKKHYKVIKENMYDE